MRMTMPQQRELKSSGWANVFLRPRLLDLSYGPCTWRQRLTANGSNLTHIRYSL